MNYKIVGRTISKILALEALFMIPPVIICAVDGNMKTCFSFLISIAATLLTAGLMYAVGKNAKRSFYAKEGFVTVGLSWIFLSLSGCLPLVLSGEIPNFIDAFFEIVSGFTTTGASVVPNVEELSRGVLYWRSFSNWLGGMGVLVFLLAIDPMGSSSLHLLRAESPGPSVGKIVPKMRQTAKILYLLYIALTVLNIIFLLFGDLPLFDSVCTALSTAGTGGFSINADGMASLTPYVQNVCTVFMMLFGINFTCFYLLLLGNFKSVFKNEELKFYLGLFVACVALIAVNVRGMYGTLEETVRHSAFQVASLITSTGFATTDFNLWPAFSKGILFLLMFVGACAGSTGGGIKCARVLLYLKSFFRSIKQTLHPQKIQLIRVSGEPTDERIIRSTLGYLCAYVLLIAGSFFIVSIDGFSFETNISAVVSCFNNMGPGFDSAGPMANYGGFSVCSKLVLIWDMLAGRLEIFPILVLFSPSTWRKV